MRRKAKGEESFRGVPQKDRLVSSSKKIKRDSFTAIHKRDRKRGKKYKRLRWKVSGQVEAI